MPVANADSDFAGANVSEPETVIVAKPLLASPTVKLPKLASAPQGQIVAAGAAHNRDGPGGRAKNGLFKCGTAQAMRRAADLSERGVVRAAGGQVEFEIGRRVTRLIDGGEILVLNRIGRHCRRDRRDRSSVGPREQILDRARRAASDLERIRLAGNSAAVENDRLSTKVTAGEIECQRVVAIAGMSDLSGHAQCTDGDCDRIRVVSRRTRNHRGELVGAADVADLIVRSDNFDRDVIRSTAADIDYKIAGTVDCRVADLWSEGDAAKCGICGCCRNRICGSRSAFHRNPYCRIIE